MGLLDVFDITQVWQRIVTFLGPVGKVLEKGRIAVVHIASIVQRSNKFGDDLVTEFKAWRSFREDIRFRSRVVNLEIAFQKTKALIEGIPAAWHSILDILHQIRSSIPGPESPTAELTDLLEPEEGTGEVVTKILGKFPKLAKGLERTAVVLGLIIDNLEKLSAFFDDLQTILDEITRLRLEIERLDTIFLEQSNKRKRIRLADGRTIRIRLGKLHSAGI